MLMNVLLPWIDVLMSSAGVCQLHSVPVRILTPGLQTTHAVLSDSFDGARRIVCDESGVRLGPSSAARTCRPSTRGRPEADRPNQPLADWWRRGGSRAALAAGGARIPRAHHRGGRSVGQLERPRVELVWLRGIILVLERRGLGPAGTGSGSRFRAGGAGPRGIRGFVTWGARPDRARCGI